MTRKASRSAPKKRPTKAAAPAPRKAAPDEARVRKIRERLTRAIPRPRCELDHRNAWELLMATILSAQSTDRTINRVTPVLFARWPNAAALAAADRADVEEVVKSTGFFRNKAKSIQEASRVLTAEHGGEVPKDVDAVIALPGVARKTANVVLGTAYGIATGMVVDTHVRRVSQRLGLTQQNDPDKIEADLCATFHKRSWIETSHRLLLHGRYVCLAKAPRCDRCVVNELCEDRIGDAGETIADRAAAAKRVVESRGDEAFA